MVMNELQSVIVRERENEKYVTQRNKLHSLKCNNFCFIFSSRFIMSNKKVTIFNRTISIVIESMCVFMIQ